MTSPRYFYTSESVTDGHPDKICDQVSDAILDAHLGQDPQARVACEVAVTTDLVVIMGEISSTAQVDVEAVARRTIAEIGYTAGGIGFDSERCQVLVALHSQSPDIARGVARDADEVGAGDQGMMFGFACDETPEGMPLTIALAHRLTRRLGQARRRGELDWLRPDGKSQVTVEYERGRPKRVDTLVLSTQHRPGMDQEEIRAQVRERIIAPAVGDGLLDAGTTFHINPTGRFEIGGPHGDCGLTGRKIMVDTYGGVARHGGGAFSGKDATKVDRSGAYMARYVARNVVAAGLARRFELQVSYAIGKVEPTSLAVEAFGTGQAPDTAIESAIRACFDLRPAAIIRELGLCRPIYRQVAAGGHFGRSDLDVPWERADRVDCLRAAVARA